MEEHAKPKAIETPAAERAMEAELERAFPMKQWRWEERHAYARALDPVLYAHIFGGERE